MSTKILSCPGLDLTYQPLYTVHIPGHLISELQLTLYAWPLLHSLSCKRRSYPDAETRTRSCPLCLALSCSCTYAVTHPSQCLAHEWSQKLYHPYPSLCIWEYHS